MGKSRPLEKPRCERSRFSHVTKATPPSLPIGSSLSPTSTLYSFVSISGDTSHWLWVHPNGHLFCSGLDPAVLQPCVFLALIIGAVAQSLQCPVSTGDHNKLCGFQKGLGKSLIPRVCGQLWTAARAAIVYLELSPGAEPQGFCSALVSWEDNRAQ